MESLTTFVKGIKEMNSLEKKKVNEGGLYINRVVLSKYLANITDVKPHLTADGRTFYDRHAEKMNQGGKDWTTNKAIVLETHTEVMAQLSNFHYLENKDYMLKILEGTIRTFLINKAKEQNVATDEHGDILHFFGTTNPNIYKVICTHPTIAHRLCCTLKDQAVTQQDSIANISFKSSFHQPMAKDWEEHIKRLAICDYDPSLPSSSDQGHQGRIPSALDRVGSNATPPPTPAHGTSEEASSSASVASAPGWQNVSAGFAREGV
jgi:hypothetical protein